MGHLRSTEPESPEGEYRGVECLRRPKGEGYGFGKKSVVQPR